MSRQGKNSRSFPSRESEKYSRGWESSRENTIVSGLAKRCLRACHGGFSQVGKFQPQISRIGSVAEPHFEINNSGANHALEFAIEVLHAFGAAIPHGID